MAEIPEALLPSKSDDVNLNNNSPEYLKMLLDKLRNPPPVDNKMPMQFNSLGEDSGYMAGPRISNNQDTQSDDDDDDGDSDKSNDKEDTSEGDKLVADEDAKINAPSKSDNTDDDNDTEDDSNAKNQAPSDDSQSSNQHKSKQTSPDFSSIDQQNPANQMSDLKKRFDAAQATANADRGAAQFQRAANLIAAGIGHLSPQTLNQLNQSADYTDKNANSAMNDLQEQVAFQAQDPGSSYSSAARNFLKSKFGANLPDTISAAQLEKTFMGPALKSFEADQQRQAVASNLQSKLSQMHQDKQASLEANKLKWAELNQNKQFNNDNKQQHYDEIEQPKIGKELNDLSASSRSVLGTASKARMQANRALDIVNDPNATTQDLSSVASDLNAIVAGTTTMTGSKHQEYSNLMTDISKGVSYISSSPNAPDVPEVKKHLANVLNRMKSISDDVINQNTQRVGANHSAWIKRHPDDFQGMLDSLKPSESSQQSQAKATQFPIQVRKDGHIATISNDKELQEARSEGWQ